MSILNPAAVSKFLHGHFDARAGSIQFIGAGWFSQAFTFAVGEQAYIFRVNAFPEDFKKDEWAYNNVSSPSLPVPKVVQIGRFDETRYFAITERCQGRMLDQIDDDQVQEIIPELFKTLDVIHRVDVSRYRGWGLTDATGNGMFPSWREYLQSLYDQKFTYQRSDLDQYVILEKDLYAGFLTEMERLLPYCPDVKHLIHRDFGFSNIVTDGKRITGVLDWADCGLGDFIFDIAYLDFFSKKIPLGDLWYAYAAAQNRPLQDFEERMRCYMLWIGLDSMASAAIMNNEHSYIRHRERTRSVLLPGRRSESDWTQ